LEQGGQVNPNNVMRGAQAAFAHNGEPDASSLLDRLSDAWAWLVAHGLVGPDANQTTSSWLRPTREGRAAAADPTAVASLWAGERLAGDLHPRLSRARLIFNLGDYEIAAFAAMKAVEVEVRELAGFDASVIGMDLMRQAFRPAGPLADASAPNGEQVALMELFSGSIGTFKNPSSHRPVDFADPIEAAEVVQTADLLLRLLDRVAHRLTDASPSTQK